jgi:hypothetical protein
VKNKLERPTDKAKKEYLQSTYDKITEFQRTGCYGLMYIRQRNWVGKKSMGFKTLASKTST